MKSMIDEFYDFESSFMDWIDRGERYDEIKERLTGLVPRFEETLNENQKMMLKELTLLNYQLRKAAEQATYKVGFKTALTLAVEGIKH